LLLFVLFVLLETLVKHTDPFNAVLGLLLCWKLKAHLHLLVVLSLVGELVRDFGGSIIPAQDLVLVGPAHVVWQVFLEDDLLLQILKVSEVVLSETGDSEVESDDLGATLSACDLDQVMHEEPGLDGLVDLAKADGCKLRDHDRGNLRAAYWDWSEDGHVRFGGLFMH